MVLWAGGAPLTVTAGTSSTKSKRSYKFNPLTVDDAIELSNEINATTNETSKILHWVKNRLGNKAVVPNAARDAVEGGRILDEFFDVTQVEMEVKKTVQTEIKGKKVSRLLIVSMPE